MRWRNASRLANPSRSPFERETVPVRPERESPEMDVLGASVLLLAFCLVVLGCVVYGVLHS